MHPDEVPTGVGLVRDLVAAQFPRWAGLPVTAVASSGTDNAMFRLGPSLVVRLPRIPSAAGDVAREQRWLTHLAPRLPVAVPTPRGRGEPGAGYPFPWSVLDWLDGENPRPTGRTGADSEVARGLAGFVAALRAVDPAGGPRSGRGGELAARDESTREALAQLDGEIDTDAAAAVWADCLAVGPGTAATAWCHGDLSPGNVLVDGGRLSAVIDFGGIGVGDPTVDLAVAWNLLSASGRDVFRAALGVDDATWERGRGWALSIALIQLPYYRTNNPVLAASARRTVNAVLRPAR